MSKFTPTFQSHPREAAAQACDGPLVPITWKRQEPGQASVAGSSTNGLNIRANLDQQVLPECANHLLFLSRFFIANYVYYVNLFYCQQHGMTQLLLNNIIIDLILAYFQRGFPLPFANATAINT